MGFEEPGRVRGSSLCRRSFRGLQELRGKNTGMKVLLSSPYLITLYVEFIILHTTQLKVGLSSRSVGICRWSKLQNLSRTCWMMKSAAFPSRISLPSTTMIKTKQIMTCKPKQRATTPMPMSLVFRPQRRPQLLSPSITSGIDSQFTGKISVSSM